MTSSTILQEQSQRAYIASYRNTSHKQNTSYSIAQGLPHSSIAKDNSPILVNDLIGCRCIKNENNFSLNHRLNLLLFGRDIFDQKGIAPYLRKTRSCHSTGRIICTKQNDLLMIKPKRFLVSFSPFLKSNSCTHP